MENPTGKVILTAAAAAAALYIGSKELKELKESKKNDQVNKSPSAKRPLPALDDNMITREDVDSPPESSTDNPQYAISLGGFTGNFMNSWQPGCTSSPNKLSFGARTYCMCYNNQPLELENTQFAEQMPGQFATKESAKGILWHNNGAFYNPGQAPTNQDKPKWQMPAGLTGDNEYGMVTNPALYGYYVAYGIYQADPCTIL